MSEKIILPYETELIIVSDYLNNVKNNDICLKFNLTAPRLYSILKKHNIPLKGWSYSTRFENDIKCSQCKEIKTKELFPCVKGVYRTLCKKCHAHNEKIRRKTIPDDIKKATGEKTYANYKQKKLNAAMGLLSLEDEITFWVKRIINRGNTAQYKDRKSLSKDILIEKCFKAKEKYPNLLFTYVENIGQCKSMIASLDKIDPKGGYTDDNTQVIPLWLNSAKLASTQDELDDMIIDYILVNDNIKNKLIKIFSE